MTALCNNDFPIYNNSIHLVSIGLEPVNNFKRHGLAEYAGRRAKQHVACVSNDNERSNSPAGPSQRSGEYNSTCLSRLIQVLIDAAKLAPSSAGRQTTRTNAASYPEIVRVEVSYVQTGYDL